MYERYVFASIVALLAGCEASIGGTQSQVDEELRLELADIPAIPLEQLVMAEPLPAPRPVPDLAATRQALATDPELAPLADALRAAGHTDEVAAEMVFASATYNAGHELDAMRARHADVSSAIRAAFVAFWRAVDEAERTHGVVFDREALAEKHVIGELGAYIQ